MSTWEARLLLVTFTHFSYCWEDWAQPAAAASAHLGFQERQSAAALVFQFTAQSPQRSLPAPWHPLPSASCFLRFW